MANIAAEAPRREEDVLLVSPIFGSRNENVKSRGQLIERKIEFLESLAGAGKVSNRRSCRWLNDRLLIELVPRLNAEDIRGLFAPPPWGDNVPVSAFCMTNVSEWDNFRNIDMDKEATIIERLEATRKKREDPVGSERMIALSAWHRIDRRTREAFRRNCLPDLVQGYEKCIRAFIKDSVDGDALVLHVQDPFHRLLLHGVCEFYDLVSVTHTKPKDGKLWKMTVIRKKKLGSQEIPPSITITRFIKVGKDGIL